MAARKIILLGDIAVGKTSLVRRLTLGRFDGDYLATVGVDIYQYTAHLPSSDGTAGADRRDAAALALVIWDIEGDMAESVLQHHYSAGASGALIVSDITRPETQETSGALASEFKQRFPGRPFVHLVNKSDLAPEISERSFPNLANTGDVVLETSALTGEGVVSAFETIAATIARRRL